MHKSADVHFPLLGLVLIYLLIGVPLTTQAQKHVEIPVDSLWTITLIDELEVLEDEQRVWSAEKLYTASDDLFEPNNLKKPRLHNYWARFNLVNSTSNNQWVSFESYYWDYVTLYLRDSTGNVAVIPFGVLSKPYDNKFLAAPQTEYHVLANFESSGQFRREDHINLVIKPTIPALKNQTLTNYLDGIFFGIMFGLALYNLFLFISLKRQDLFLVFHVYYGLRYQLCHTIFQHST